MMNNFIGLRKPNGRDDRKGRRKKVIKKVSIILLVGMLMVISSAPAFATEKQVVGWVEIAAIYPGNLKLKAKLDTGARNSSLNVKKLEYFKRDDQTWVKFEIRNFKDRMEHYEAKVVRTAQIKRLGQKPDTRQVITLGICVGNTYKEVEVNLTDRTGFNYQMLIGRSFLKGSFIVDPEASFVSQPECTRLDEK